MGRLMLKETKDIRTKRKFALCFRPLPPCQPQFDPDPALPEWVFPASEDLLSFEISMETLVEMTESTQGTAKLQSASEELVKTVDRFKKTFVKIARTKDKSLRHHFRYNRLLQMWADLLKQVWVQLVIHVETRLKKPDLWWRKDFPEQAKNGLDMATDMTHWIQSALHSRQLW